MIQATTRSPLRRISFLDLSRVLDIAPRELRSIVASKTFPAYAGYSEGQREWRVLAVAAWLESSNFPADAAAVLAFEGDEPDDGRESTAGPKSLAAPRRARLARRVQRTND